MPLVPSNDPKEPQIDELNGEWDEFYAASLEPGGWIPIGHLKDVHAEDGLVKRMKRLGRLETKRRPYGAPAQLAELARRGLPTTEEEVVRRKQD